MLDIDIVPIRGVLCVRLSGSLTKDNIDKLRNEVIKLQTKVGIKNIVFNVRNLKEIDNAGLRALIGSFNLCKQNNGQSFICFENNSQLSKHFFNEDEIVDDELSAINIVNL